MPQFTPEEILARAAGQVSRLQQEVETVEALLNLAQRLYVTVQQLQKQIESLRAPVGTSEKPVVDPPVPPNVTPAKFPAK